MLLPPSPKSQSHETTVPSESMDKSVKSTVSAVLGDTGIKEKSAVGGLLISN